MKEISICKNCKWCDQISEFYACEVKIRLRQGHYQNIPVNAFPDGHCAYFLKNDNSGFGIERK